MFYITGVTFRDSFDKSLTPAVYRAMDGDRLVQYIWTAVDAGIDAAARLLICERWGQAPHVLRLERVDHPAIGMMVSCGHDRTPLIVIKTRRWASCVR